MSVNLQDLLLASQAGTLDSAGKGFVHAMNVLANIANKKFDEVGLVQAAAAKELGKAGLASDLASLRPPALPAVA